MPGPSKKNKDGVGPSTVNSCTTQRSFVIRARVRRWMSLRGLREAGEGCRSGNDMACWWKGIRYHDPAPSKAVSNLTFVGGRLALPYYVQNSPGVHNGAVVSGGDGLCLDWRCC